MIHDCKLTSVAKVKGKSTQIMLMLELCVRATSEPAIEQIRLCLAKDGLQRNIAFTFGSHTKTSVPS